MGRWAEVVLGVDSSFLVAEIKFDIRKKHIVCGCEREGGWVSEGVSWVRVSAYVYTCVCIHVCM